MNITNEDRKTLEAYDPDVLAHFGILGMKWGVRRYQNEDGSLTPAGKDRYGDGDDLSTNKSKEDNSISKQKASGNRAKTLAKIGAGVALTGLAAYGVYKLQKSGKLGELADNGKNTIDKLFGNKDGKSEIETPSWIEDINPGFKHSNSPEYRMNCGNCAIAYELQSRGIKSEAMANGFGMTKEKLLSHFTGTNDKTVLNLDKIADVPFGFSESDTIKRGKQIQDQLTKQIRNTYKSSDTARGTLFVPGTLGSHWVSWEKRGSSVKFFNSQDTSRDLIKSCFGMCMPTGDSTTSLTAIRLDDLDINMESVKDSVLLKRRG